MAAKHQPASGCGFILMMCVSVCVLILVNSSLVLVAYRWAEPSLPSWLANNRTAQALLYVVPLFMVIGEWWLIDWGRELFGIASDSLRARFDEPATTDTKPVPPNRDKNGG